LDQCRAYRNHQARDDVHDGVKDSKQFLWSSVEYISEGLNRMLNVHDNVNVGRQFVWISVDDIGSTHRMTMCMTMWMSVNSVMDQCRVRRKH
jgi:hypothetical protein